MEPVVEIMDLVEQINTLLDECSPQEREILEDFIGQWISREEAEDRLNNLEEE